jgi:hypothetical protein
VSDWAAKTAPAPPRGAAREPEDFHHHFIGIMMSNPQSQRRNVHTRAQCRRCVMMADEKNFHLIEPHDPADPTGSHTTTRLWRFSLINNASTRRKRPPNLTKHQTLQPQYPKGVVPLLYTPTIENGRGPPFSCPTRVYGFRDRRVHVREAGQNEGYSQSQIT